MNTNRVLSKLERIKDAIVTKIDKVDASVSGLPNTLETQFNDVKADIAAVKTAVDGAAKTLDSINGEVV